MFRSKWVKIPLYSLTIGFALIGFFLCSAYAAIQFKWTNEKGSVDQNSRYLGALQAKTQRNEQADSLEKINQQYQIMQRLLVMRDYYPKNAQNILDVWNQTGEVAEVIRMVDAVDLIASNNDAYKKARQQVQKQKGRARGQNTSVFEWMNMPEWDVFRVAVEKDRELIDSAARLTGVESRLIVSCLVGEQIRLFNSDREAYKKWIGPLKILSVESQFSLGVTGIKDFTAAKMEALLKDSSSVYYMGKQYEKLLDFKTEDITQERFDRLTSFRNHFYSYLYAAVFLKQVKMQWERAGHPIDHRPEILATLFNVGYPQSVPKQNPRVGGSTIMIREVPYTFGMIAYQFYYSGELNHLFPVRTKKFDWHAV